MDFVVDARRQQKFNQHDVIVLRLWVIARMHDRFGGYFKLFGPIYALEVVLSEPHKKWPAKKKCLQLVSAKKWCPTEQLSSALLHSDREAFPDTELISRVRRVSFLHGRVPLKSTEADRLTSLSGSDAHHGENIFFKGEIS